MSKTNHYGWAGPLSCALIIMAFCHCCITVEKSSDDRVIRLEELRIEELKIKAGEK